LFQALIPSLSGSLFSCVPASTRFLPVPARDRLNRSIPCPYSPVLKLCAPFCAPYVTPHADLVCSSSGPSKKKNVLSAIVNIVPGTHHLKFIVDGDMRTSDMLPTAVDYTNILVNYLEVSLDDLPQSQAAADEVKKSDPVPVPDYGVPPGLHPPQVLPPSPELRAIASRTRAEAEQAAAARKKLAPPPEPPKRYHSNIPRYLQDLDAPEDSSRSQRANTAASNLPAPPTLPMFLSKSILNGTMPMKDDSSVLIMPNHTVLNHLATSSIKDNILATSATTRYQQKVRQAKFALFMMFSNQAI